MMKDLIFGSHELGKSFEVSKYGLHKEISKMRKV